MRSWIIYEEDLQGCENLAGNEGQMKLEVLEKDCYYHIYNRGINGTTIFENDANKLYFLKQLAKFPLIEFQFLLIA